MITIFKIARLMIIFLLAGSVFGQAPSQWVADDETGCKVYNPDPEPNETIKFNGLCSDGLANGFGTVRWFKDGIPRNVVTGKYVNGRSTGKIQVKYRNGDFFEGFLNNGNRNGQGTYTVASGSKYVGEWKDGKRNGQGIAYKADGTVASTGNWSDGNLVNSFALDLKRFPFNAPLQTERPSSAKTDRLTANITLAQTSLPACQGTNFFNLNNCFGTHIFPDGAKYVGEWKEMMMHGRGIFTSAKGFNYIGEWKENNYNGQGTLSASDGSVISQGIWANGNFIRSALDQQASVSNQSLPSVALQPDNSEREKLIAEIEVGRKKRQVLEEQLRVAQQSTKLEKPTLIFGIERRVALIIGNSTYKFNPLKNPVNDSNDMARSLRSVGFDVIEVNNATLVQMREATRRFADKLSNSDVGLVYYSGHGVEVRGKNYLITVNADIKREYEVVDQAFDASQFLEMMDNIRGPNNKRVNILIVDACRNNELERSWRSTTNGLARMDAPGGTFISFATAPGRVAADGVGRNSPYTKHLLQALKQPNIPIEQVFKIVRRNVMDETKGEQIPWENSSLVGDFFFSVQR